MDATRQIPMLYCPRCHCSTEALLGSELACPRCGGRRQFLKFGYTGTLPGYAQGRYMRTHEVDEAMQMARMHMQI